MIKARVQFATTLRLGEVVRARLMLHHPMITGYDRNSLGQVIPRRVITEVICEYAGQLIFKAQPSSSITANPLFEFGFRLKAWSRFEAHWVDDLGVRGVLTHELTEQGPWEAALESD